MSRGSNILEEMTDKFLPESLQEILSFLANLCTIGTILYPAIRIVYGIFWIQNAQNLKSIPWNDILIPALVLFFVSLLLRYIIQISRSRNIEANVCKNYYWFLHDYRNATNNLEKEYKKGILSEEMLHGEVKSYLEAALNYLSDTLSSLTGKPVCSCVKLIIGGDVDGVKYEEARVKTFARSHNTDRERTSIDVRNGKKGVLISENTDFVSIVTNNNGNGSYFYEGNLKKFEKKLHKHGEKYLNTTNNWSKYYIGTIVAPIRAANNILFYRRKDEDYCIWGFLCVDSLYKTAFPKHKKRNYTHIVKSYAAVLFNVMSKYQYYLIQLNKPNHSSSYVVKTDNNYVRGKNARNNSYSRGKNKKGKCR